MVYAVAEVEGKISTNEQILRERDSSYLIKQLTSHYYDWLVKVTMLGVLVHSKIVINCTSEIVAY